MGHEKLNMITNRNDVEEEVALRFVQEVVTNIENDRIGMIREYSFVLDVDHRT